MSPTPNPNPNPEPEQSSWAKSVEVDAVLVKWTEALMAVMD